MLTANGLGQRRTGGSDAPVELRFVDMLLIIIATLMFVAVVLTIASAFAGSGRSNVAPRIITRSAPAALTDQSYQLWLAAEGGDGSYTWRIAAGTLPQGLFLTPEGTVRGIPARVQSSQVTIEVADGQRRSYDQQLVFDVRPSGSRTAQQTIPPRVVSDTILLPEAVNGRPYAYDLAVSAGIPPYQWALTAGRLPPGLNLTSQGNLLGRPQQSGRSTFTVRVVDSTGSRVTQRVSLVVRDGPQAIWQRVLGWIKTVATIMGYILVSIWIIALIFGSPATGGTPPIWKRFKKPGQP